MNALEKWIADNDESERLVLNRLIDAGIISDNNLSAEDVWWSDVDRAIEFLESEATSS